MQAGTQMAKADCKSVDAYIASQPDAIRPILGQVRNAIRKACRKPTK
jgi:hypothetical protein